ncbi:isocyanide synthase family protein [Saccharopolyspora sp. K220]|uniref:L-tyrosine/L-tryptophan isonitrile synthase family protein n=1 Tax=Saccharopolyspora soli TaxID=2926618 RepID=UPI001F5A1DA9|nr:L-tyrosine/L-tryptophan isonitrile synthase family protein [Saccharopolyspora soli]MCI2422278.1 isocyanide synthase family protein [Saccharopolyspora soli]
MQGLIAQDDLLSLYCGPSGASSGEQRFVLPLGELVAGKLRRVLDGRPFGWAELDYLVEFVVRPIVVTTRGLLVEGFRPAGGFAVELAAEFVATGRAVPAGVLPVDAAGGSVSESISALHRELESLATAFAHVAASDRAAVRAAFERITAQELRYLAAETAALLAGDHPWRHHVHSVPTGQHELLSGVIRRVKQRNIDRRRDRSLPRPVVAVDLDFCALLPRQRVRAALSHLGRAHGIEKLAAAHRLAVLPGLYPAGWPLFLAHNRLREDHPDVDWDAVYAEFRKTLSWSHDALLTDEPAPGLIRFVRAVEHAGGRVVWATGRRPRMRPATGELLVRHGLGQLDLHTTPDERSDVGAHKVEALRELPDAEVVAAFDDLESNRAELRAAFPDATVVAVRPTGFSTEPRIDPGIATFEFLPHPTPLGRGHASRQQRAKPELSHATSIAELPVGEFSTRPTIWGRGVRLTAEQQVRIIELLCANAVRSGRILGRRARDELGRCTDPAAIARAVRKVLMAKPFGAARSVYPPETAVSDMTAAIAAGERITFVMLGPPVKQDGSRLKALGGAPDLAEVAVLARLRQLEAAVQQVYPPGIEVLALADPSHFRARDPQRCADYHDEFGKLLEQTGARRAVTLVDIDDAADAHPNCGDRAQRPELLAKHRDRYATAFAGLDVRRDPLPVLAEAAERDPREPGQPRFVEMFRSVLHAIDVPHQGGDPFAWSQQLYADPYELVNPAVPARVRTARADLLAATWRETITYLANKHVDHELNYQALWRDRVRMSLSIRPAEGRFRFLPIGGSGVMPWHGTAALNNQREVSVDYAISLVHQGFVPVYAPNTQQTENGVQQPWFMLPASEVHNDLDSAVLNQIRLRNR